MENFHAIRKSLNKFTNGYEIKNGVLTDGRTLYITTGQNGFSEIQKFCEQLLDNVVKYIDTTEIPFNRTYRVNIVLNMNEKNFVNSYAEWSIIHFVDPRVVNVLVSKETLKQQNSKLKWSTTPPLLAEEKKTIIPELSGNIPYVNLYLNRYIRSNTLISKNVPSAITKDDIYNMFYVYCDKPPVVTLNKKGRFSVVTVKFSNKYEASVARCMHVVNIIKIGRNNHTIRFNFL